VLGLETAGPFVVAGHGVRNLLHFVIRLPLCPFSTAAVQRNTLNSECL